MIVVIGLDIVPVFNKIPVSGHEGRIVIRIETVPLNGYTGKNHFYRANRELGRIFKTEYILQYLSDKTMRQRVRRGLLGLTGGSLF